MAAVTAAAIGAGAAIYGGVQAAQAAGKAAKAQGDAADAWQSYVSGQEDKADSLLANAYTPAQLSQYDQTLNSQTATVQRQERLAQSLEPSLIESGKQLTSLLQGQSAPVLNNIKNQRDIQRTGLINQLNEQFGAGGASSAAGLQALQKFDSETANAMSNAQQSYIQQLSGLSLSGMSAVTGNSNSANSLEANLIGNSPEAVTARARAQNIASFTNSGGQAENAKIEAAGGQYAQDQILGQTVGNIGSGLMQFGGAALGKGAAKKDTADGSTLNDDLYMNASPSAANNYSNVLGWKSLASKLAG